MTKRVDDRHDLATWLRAIADGIDAGEVIASSHTMGPDGISRVSVTCAKERQVFDEDLPGTTIDDDAEMTPSTAPAKGQHGPKRKK